MVIKQVLTNVIQISVSANLNKTTTRQHNQNGSQPQKTKFLHKLSKCKL